MADRYLLENGTDRYLLEDGSGVYLLEDLPTFYGAVGADAKANWRIGPDGKISHRFRATTTAALNTIRWSQRFGASGYSGGTGGTIDITVEADASGEPSGTALATLTYVPGNPADSTSFLTHTWPTPATLTAGNLYHIVFTNTDGSPSTNFMSSNHIVTLAGITVPRTPYYPDTDYAILTKLGAGPWTLGNGGGSWIAVMDLGYANGYHDGQSYIEAMVAQVASINSTTSMVRERFLVTGGNRITSGAKVRLKRTSGTDVLTVRLEDSGGTLIDSFTIAAASIPTANYEWASGSWAAIQTLTNGTTYNLRLSTAAGTTYTAVPVRQGYDSGDSGGTGNPTGFRSDSFRDGVNLRADGMPGGGQKTTDGTNYTDLYGFSPVDLQFYFALATVVTPGTASLVLTRFTPTVTASANVSVTPGVAALTLTRFTPVVTVGVNVVPGTASLTLTRFTPVVSVSNNQLVTPGIATLTLAGFAPQIQLAVIPGKASLVVTAFAPTVSTTNHQTVTPGIGTLVLTAFTPTVTASGGLTVTPGTASLVLTAFAPTVSTTAHVTVTPGTATLSLTGFAPQIRLAVTPGTASLTLTAFAPTVSTPVTATPGVATLTLTRFAPTVSAGANVTVTPGVASLILTRFTPTVSATAHQTVTPGLASLGLTAFAPVVFASDFRLVTPGTASLTLASFAPIVSTAASILIGGTPPGVSAASSVPLGSASVLVPSGNGHSPVPTGTASNPKPGSG